MKNLRSLLLALCIVLSLSACGGGTDPGDVSEHGGNSSSVELVVFAAASMTETLDEIIALYKDVAPHVTILPSY